MSSDQNRFVDSTFSKVGSHKRNSTDFDGTFCVDVLISFGFVRLDHFFQVTSGIPLVLGVESKRVSIKNCQTRG